MAKGGIIQGKSHDEGGEKFVVQETGQHIEAEGKEAVASGDALESAECNESKTYTGTTKQIISQINKVSGDKSANEKATELHAGDYVINKDSTTDSSKKEVTGTCKQVVKKLNNRENNHSGKLQDGGSVGQLLAPNGKPSNLTSHQWHLVRTPEFKKWFGDWENSPEAASKVVDENGEPLVVYHGTRHDFSKFDIEKQGSNYEMSIGGFFFTPDKDDANWYTEEWDHSDRQRTGFFPNIMPVYLKIINPLEYNIHKRIYPFDEPATFFDNFKKEIINEFESKNFDGIIIKGNYPTLIYCIKPSQIKSAIGNIGSFDRENPDIILKNGGEIETGKKIEFKGKEYNIQQEGDEYFIIVKIYDISGETDTESYPKGFEYLDLDKAIAMAETMSIDDFTDKTDYNLTVWVESCDYKIMVEKDEDGDFVIWDEKGERIGEYEVEKTIELKGKNTILKENTDKTKDIETEIVSHYQSKYECKSAGHYLYQSNYCLIPLKDGFIQLRISDHTPRYSNIFESEVKVIDTFYAQRPFSEFNQKIFDEFMEKAKNDNYEIRYYDRGEGFEEIQKFERIKIYGILNVIIYFDEDETENEFYSENKDFREDHKDIFKQIRTIRIDIKKEYDIDTVESEYLIEQIDSEIEDFIDIVNDYEPIKFYDDDEKIESMEQGGEIQKFNTGKILWGVKIGDPDWKEQIITENPYLIEKAKAWAEKNGFDRFRIAIINLSEKPDFVKTIRKKQGGEIQKFSIPKEISYLYEIEGDFSNVQNWSGQIMEKYNPNRYTDEYRKGKTAEELKKQESKIRYIMISLDSNHIIPITIYDEHHTGYDVLYDYYYKKHKVKEENYISICSYDNDYVYYPQNNQRKDYEDSIKAYKKFIEYGGNPNMLIYISDYTGQNNSTIMTVDEFTKYEGELKNAINSRQISYNGKYFISKLEELYDLFSLYHSDFTKQSNEKYKERLFDKCKDFLNIIFFRIDRSSNNIKEMIKNASDKMYKVTQLNNESLKILEEALFSFDGIKNIIHTQLKQKNKDLENIFFNLDIALRMFNDIDRPKSEKEKEKNIKEEIIKSEHDVEIDENQSNIFNLWPNIARAYEVALVNNFSITIDFPTDIDLDYTYDFAKKHYEIIKKYLSDVNFSADGDIWVSITVPQNTGKSKANKLNFKTLRKDIEDRVAKAKKVRTFSTNLNEPSLQIIKNACDKLYFSIKDIKEIIKISTSIAKLDNSNKIDTHHIAEAIHYRMDTKSNLKTFEKIIHKSIDETDDYNLIGLWANLKRVYEVAMVGNFSITMFYNNEDTYQREKTAIEDYLEIKKFYKDLNFVENNGDIFFELIKPNDYTVIIKNIKYETLEALQKRIDNAKKITQVNTKLGEASLQLINSAKKHLILSKSDEKIIINLSESIAKLDGDTQIQTHHIAEAIQYRALVDKKYVINLEKISKQNQPVQINETLIDMYEGFIAYSEIMIEEADNQQKKDMYEGFIAYSEMMIEDIKAGKIPEKKEHGGKVKKEVEIYGYRFTEIPRIEDLIIKRNVSMKAYDNILRNKGHWGTGSMIRAKSLGNGWYEVGRNVTGGIEIFSEKTGRAVTVSSKSGENNEYFLNEFLKFN